MLTVLSGFSEFEREVIKERVTNGRKAKKATGVYAGGQPKLGYQVKHETVNINGKLITNKSLVIDPKEQELIILIKKHRRSGKSYSEIAKYLNENSYKTKQGKQFTQVQIQRVLESK
jgi:site-specific DNA recombinase